MITKLLIRNFKKLGNIQIELDQPVVFIGPNNSGKTTALQALSLWETGYKLWTEKRGFDKDKAPKDRPGITINRKELSEIPLSDIKLLWKNKHVFEKTDKIFIDVLLEGVNDDIEWKCGFEFYFANDESIYCRPLRLSNTKNPERMPVPEIPGGIRIAYLHPMSGLSETEFLKQPGEIAWLLGQGQTAQVLRNLCFSVFKSYPHNWELVVKQIEKLFGAKILEPEFTDRSEIRIKYTDPKGADLDLPSSGRGLQQVLLLLVYLYSNPKSVLLLDEPDAHLEILRQREIFSILCEIANQQESQIIAASHSEVVLTEAASLGKVVAFIGTPHTMNDRGSQLLKSLTTIGWDQYAMAEQKGWVLYLEDASDLAILKALAEKIKHPALEILKTSFAHYISTNLPQLARDHFYGIKEGKDNFVGIAIFDRLPNELSNDFPLIEATWKKREIENYFCLPQVLVRFAESTAEFFGPLFMEAERTKRITAMEKAIEKISNAMKTLGREPWSDEIKVSDEFINLILKDFSEQLGVPLILRKNRYFKLIDFIQPHEIDNEVVTKLDLIVKVSKKSKPAQND
jgi:hypothetical protein